MCDTVLNLHNNKQQTTPKIKKKKTYFSMIVSSRLFIFMISLNAFFISFLCRKVEVIIDVKFR